MVPAEIRRLRSPFPAREPMKNPLLPLLVFLLLGGCFNPNTDRAGTWNKPGATEDEIYADISSCRQQANAIIERDAAIDSDISAGTANNTFDTTASDLEANLDAYDAGNRYKDLVAECMHGRGYALAAEG
jgi:hypothetical protein